MSHTDKTRPEWVQQRDPLNQRFRKIGSMMWSNDGTSEHFYKKMFPLHQCWCCSQKRYWATQQATDRMLWRRERRRLEKGAWRDET